MKNLIFYNLFNKILFTIEKYLDTFDNTNDIDYEINYQILTITFKKNKKIIISKQEILQQIWLATNDHGYHFKYKNKNWICNRSQRNFWNILEESFHIFGEKQANFSQFYLKK
ncbi:iron donor protein CyaY [Buchnera aphidicola]|nr:iron donor protein CyaY [Buchnera aphidicola (Stegophylla sp.)]